MRAGVVISLVGLVQGPLMVGYELKAVGSAAVPGNAILNQKIKLLALGGDFLGMNGKL